MISQGQGQLCEMRRGRARSCLLLLNRSKLHTSTVSLLLSLLWSLSCPGFIWKGKTNKTISNLGLALEHETQASKGEKSFTKTRPRAKGLGAVIDWGTWQENGRIPIQMCSSIVRQGVSVLSMTVSSQSRGQHTVRLEDRRNRPVYHCPWRPPSVHMRIFLLRGRHAQFSLAFWMNNVCLLYLPIIEEASQFH